MSIYFYSANEDNQKIESINKYKYLFSEYSYKNPSLNESLFQMFISNKNTELKAKLLVEDILYKSETIINNNFFLIKQKYQNLSKDDAIIIATYTCQLPDIRNSPYIILNKNLCEENKEKGIKNISKYLYLFLKSLRKLNKYYPNQNYLYRCIDTQVDIEKNNFNKNKIFFSRGNMKTFWGFSSVTSQIRKTLNIDNKKIDYNQGTIFTLYGNIWGYDISLFNDKMDEEIILEPEQNYLVRNAVPSINNKIINLRIKIENCNNILKEAYLFENKSDFGYKNNSEDKFIIKYEIEYSKLKYFEDYIRIFGEKFVQNNKLKCKYIHNKEEFNLTEFFPINELRRGILEIELKGIENIVYINDMFKECEYLSSLPDLSKLNISKYNDLSNMFKNCKSLSYLPDISKWDISNVKDMSYIFYGCSSLKKLPDLSKWNTKEVNNIDSMFNSCNSLVLLPDISNWDISNVSNMNCLFYGCSNLKYLPNISKWNTINIKNMGRIFQNCQSLKCLPDISKWNTKNVIYMEGLFNNCNLLTFLPDISIWDTSKVTSIYSMFSNCISLLYLPDISKWNVSNVDKIYDLFNRCKSLSILPDISKWKLTKIQSLSYIFNECKSLTSIPDISKWDNSNVNDISHIFGDCVSLLYIPSKFNFKKNKIYRYENATKNCISLLSDHKFYSIY